MTHEAATRIQDSKIIRTMRGGPKPLLGLTSALAATLLLLGSCSSEHTHYVLEEFQDNNIVNMGLGNTYKLALTFDDGPTGNTGRLLNILADEGIKATFFVVGNQISGRTALLERMRDEGHIVANHTRTHDSLRDASPQKAAREIGYTHEEIKDYNDGHRFYFRAPYGAWSDRHVDRLNSNRELRRYIGPIFWNAGGDTKFNSAGEIISAADWECWSKRRGVSTCTRGYLREISRKKGGVVLMHDVKRKTVDMVERLIPKLKDRGYSFVTLDDVRALDQYEIN